MPDRQTRNHKRAGTPQTLEERAILEAFVVGNPELERLEGALGQFNIFEAVGAVDQESRHSDFLAFLLDPRASHGLGDLFVRMLLQKAVAGVSSCPVNAIDLDGWSLSDMAVEREWRNIDILLRDERHRLVVIIENKVGTTEHSGQLQRYREVVERHYPGWKILALYLTPEGEEPSDPGYLTLDYGLVCKLLEGIAQTRASTLGTDVRTLINHYTQMLRRHVMDDPEIAELCRHIYRNHQRALDLIYEHRPDRLAKIRERLEELVKATKGVVLDSCSKRFIRFAGEELDVPLLQDGEGWTSSGRILLFEFQNEPTFLKLKLIIGPGPRDTRQRLLEMAQANQPPFACASKSLNQKWNTIFDRGFLTPKSYEDASDEDLTAEISRHWAAFLESEFPSLVATVKKQRWIRQ